MILDVSIDEPSGAGNGLRSTTVIFVFENSSRFARAHAVERPKTPEPTIKMESGGLKGDEEEGFEEDGDIVDMS